MSWLKSDAVRGEANGVVGELKTQIAERRSTASGSYEHAAFAKVVGDSLAAGQAIQREWFCDSVGMSWADGEQETYYVTRAPVATAFVQFNVVHWTHWVGRLSTLIRDHLDTCGRYPDKLLYGPPHKPEQILQLPVGPWVRYQFTDGRLVDFTYRDGTGVVSHAAEPAPPPAAVDRGPRESVRPRDEAPAFGLKDIVELRDLDQDDRIRGPMAGVYILTGGPGVGKTSVALHRIPYLLLQQEEQLPAEIPNAPPDFFRTESMQVVVWKDHLVGYLEKCLRDLGFGTVPVYHVDDWVARTLRDYVPIGREQYQIVPSEPDHLRRIKFGTPDGPGGRWGGLTEQMLVAYLTGRADGGRYHNPLADEVTAEFADLQSGIEELFEGQPLRPHFQDAGSRVTPTVGGVDVAVKNLRDGLDRLAEEVNETIRVIRNPGKGNRGVKATDPRPYERIRGVITKARDAVSAVRDRLVDRLTAEYPATLAAFYGSDPVRRAVTDRFGSAAAERFCKESAGQITRRRLSQTDRYLLLWLIHLVTRGGTAGRQQARPLRQYSHTMIDEAQYYHPLVLRLLIELAMPPVGSVTIVGDLEQKVSNDGGLVGWEDAGIKVEPGKSFRLNTNYRWSQAVFAFLDLYRRRTGLKELKPPRRWASGAGLTPVVVACDDEDQQAIWLVDRIADIRRTEWSVAVVVPPTLGEDWRQRVIDDLASCDIRSRWAIGEDVKECAEKIILTNYESIVGLEFDVVLLPGCDRVLAPPTPGVDAVQAAWVALTRARQFVAVSHVGPVAVFDHTDFAPYRSANV